MTKKPRKPKSPHDWDIIDQLEYIHASVCDSECWGRCRLCPSDVVARAMRTIDDLRLGRKP